MGWFRRNLPFAARHDEASAQIVLTNWDADWWNPINTLQFSLSRCVGVTYEEFSVSNVPCVKEKEREDSLQR